MPSRGDCAYVVLLLFALFLPIVVAHTEDASEQQGEIAGNAGMSHQFVETTPHHHFAQGHVFAGILLLILWASFFYVMYDLIQLLRRERRKHK